MPQSAVRAKRIPTRNLVQLDAVRHKLALVWLAGAGICITLVVVQSLMGRYQEMTQDAWGWLLPTIMPSLGMIVSVLGYSALDPMFSRAVVRKTFFQVAIWLSLAYLFLILLTILIQPFAAGDAKAAIQLMHTSNLWLGPIQGLVVSALGVLFVSKKDDPGGDVVPAIQ